MPRELHGHCFSAQYRKCFISKRLHVSVLASLQRNHSTSKRKKANPFGLRPMQTNDIFEKINYAQFFDFNSILFGFWTIKCKGDTYWKYSTICDASCGHKSHIDAEEDVHTEKRSTFVRGRERKTDAQYVRMGHGIWFFVFMFLPHSYMAAILLHQYNHGEAMLRLAAVFFVYHSKK